MDFLPIIESLLNSGTLGAIVVVLAWAYWQEKKGRKEDNDFWIEKLDKLTESTFQFHEALKRVLEENGRRK